MKGLRNYFNNIKPNFINDGKYNKWFPLFDAIENLFFTTKSKTSNPIHVRDAVDIQKIMVTVWLATFPAMFFGMYNLGSYSLEYLNLIGQENTGDWHHIFVSMVGYDHTSGFGLLRTINSTKLNPLKLGDSDEIKVDELLFVMPYPDQGQASAANAVSRRSFAGWWEYYLDKPIYTFPMNYSWAGTPLINQQGEILGIGSLFVSESLSPGVSSPGNLFVPINDLKPILKDLIDNGRRTKNIKPYMGLSSEDSTGKVSVTRVNENGPAAKAGIMPNDVILSVNGKDVRNMTEFYKTVWGLGGPGTVLKLDIDRNEQRLSFELTTMDRNDFFVKPKYY